MQTVSPANYLQPEIYRIQAEFGELKNQYAMYLVLQPVKLSRRKVNRGNRKLAKILLPTNSAVF